MTLIGTSQSIAQNIVEFLCSDGRFPAMVIEGIDQGDCDLVVFGAPSQSGSQGEAKKRVGAQFISQVPFGLKNQSQSRKGLYPYWETR